VNDARLQRLLERAADEGRLESQERAWRLVEEAFNARTPGRARPSARVIAVAAATVLAALTVAFAFTAPGSAVADWIRDQVVGKPGAKHSSPALTRLPGGGRLLVHSPAGVWVVSADGSRRLLGAYDGATWSPRGLFVGVWRRHELLAVEPGGRIRWSLARAGAVRGARWSPDGYRIAYLAGPTLRVVAGDGTGDKQFRASVPAVAPAWKPNAPHLLAYAAGRRAVELASTDLNARAWRTRVHERPRFLAWSPDGRILAVAGRSSVSMLDGANGRLLRLVAIRRGFAIAAMGVAPRGHRLAIVANSPARRALAVSVDALRGRPTTLFAGAGRFTSASWSPDGRWVLIAWPEADQLLFLRSSRVTALSAVRGVARQFDPRSVEPGFPKVGPWCCS
jgi:dipeptidyl aminopeptidase/acylaminoacyl peptidase